MKTTESLELVVVAFLACAVVSPAADAVLAEGAAGGRNHTFYIGLAYGPTTVKPGSANRTVEGIDFTLDAEANDLGGAFYGGYWISEHVALELGGRDYGNVHVPFSFHDPHDNTSGTGESEVAVDGFSASLLLGFDLTRDFQVFARAGMLSWKESLKSRFDIPGEPAIRRETEMSGTGLLYGAGVSWRFESTWSLQLQYEATRLDEDDVSMVSLGLAYDFLGLLRN